MKGFIRRQEENLAVKLLKWQYQKANRPEPDQSILDREAERIVEDAHRIARERGQNVVGIIKELIGEIRK